MEYPEWVKRKLEEAGFFKMTSQQRAESIEKFLEALRQVDPGDRQACHEALRRIRGDLKGGGTD